MVIITIYDEISAITKFGGGAAGEPRGVGAKRGRFIASRTLLNNLADRDCAKS